MYKLFYINIVCVLTIHEYFKVQVQVIVKSLLLTLIIPVRC